MSMNRNSLRRTHCASQFNAATEVAIEVVFLGFQDELQPVCAVLNVELGLIQIEVLDIRWHSNPL